MSTSNIQKKYAETVFLSYISKNSPGLDHDYPKYLEEELGVEKPGAFVKKLIAAGYAARQRQHIVLTDAGAELIGKQEDLVKFFELGSIYLTVQDYAERKAAKPDKNYCLIMTELLRERVKEFKKKDDYEAVIALHTEIAMLYEQANLPLQALHHYLVVLYLDVSGLEYYDSLLRYIDGKCKADAVKESYEFIYIRPEVQSGIKRLKDSYDPEIVDWIYQNNKISINLCSKKLFVALISDIMSGEFSEIEWQKRFEEAFGKILEIADGYRKKAKNGTSKQIKKK